MSFNFILRLAPSASSETFKKSDGNTVAATYIVSSGHGQAVVTGTAIHDTTQQGKPGIRVNCKVVLHNRATFYNGMLMLNEKQTSERSPQRVGVLRSKFDEVRVAVWENTKDGETYWSAKASAIESAAPTASSRSIDDANDALTDAANSDQEDYG